ncbi:uncharacterized protein LOC105200562 [Solenopsis invicta]|uniref:uncharacterized protein LOC105200562 n=1 Tax=Solenopsis invicta TaxID=13686 RepID=UPI000595C7D0|nr:uncharacterized protein LOC105200562 [Solenopsis invicta]
MRPRFWCSVYFILLATAGPTHSGRPVRALAFRKGSTFFYRLNYKINSLPYTTIFAQAAGFKAAWELPTTGGSRKVRSVPDIYKCAELVYESHGFDGRSCLLKNICQGLQYARQKDGVIGKILKLLAGSYINNGTWHEDPLFCEYHTTNCPLQLVGFNSFTEL